MLLKEIQKNLLILKKMWITPIWKRKKYYRMLLTAKLAPKTVV